MKLKSIFYSCFLWLCLALPVVLYFCFIGWYSINIPYVDDHGLKGFILKFYSSGSIIDKINSIFAQHNEHRIALTRIILLFIYTLKHEIDYNWLIWIGNIFLVGIFFIYVHYFKMNTISAWFLLPIPGFLFTFLHHENTYWGMASVQNFGVVFLSLLSFLFYEKQRISLVIVFIVLAVFTSGNGLIALIIIAGFSILKGDKKQNIPILITTVVVLSLYFFDYQKPPATPQATFSDWKNLSKAIIAFMGSYADMSLESSLSNRTLKSLVLGVILILASLFCIAKNLPIDLKTKKITFSEKYPFFIICTLILIILTTILVSWSRLIGFGFSTILTSRYKIYSVILMITLYTWFIQFTSKKTNLRLLIIVLPLSILSYINGFWQSISSIDFHRKTLITNMFNWTNEDFSGKIIVPKGYNYQNPTTIFDYYKPVLLTNSFKDLPYFKLTQLTKTKSELLISGTVESTFFKYPDDGVYIIAKSDKRTYIFPTQCKKVGLKNIILERSIFTSQFECSIPYYELEKNLYHLGLMVSREKRSTFFNTGDTFQILNQKKEAIKTNW